MNKINILRYQYSIVAGVWGLLALLVVGSIYNSPMDFLINSIVATLFALFAILIYRRGMVLCALLSDGMDTSNSAHRAVYRRVIKYELISMAVVGVLGALFLFAAFSRVFGEGYAVFG
jgi:hypothetical protein